MGSTGAGQGFAAPITQKDKISPDAVKYAENLDSGCESILSSTPFAACLYVETCPVPLTSLCCTDPDPVEVRGKLPQLVEKI